MQVLFLFARLPLEGSMRARVLGLYFLGFSIVMPACGDDTTTPLPDGPTTTITCGPGTTLSGTTCVGMSCGTGTESAMGSCRPSAGACGTGTHFDMTTRACVPETIDYGTLIWTNT